MEKSKRPTMIDVAKASGVSHQTVSRVINQDAKVAPETRERVLKVIQELNYSPSRIARSLAARRTNTLAVITYDLSYYGPTQMVVNVERAARSAGYDIIFANIDPADEQDIRAISNHISGWLVDGILLIAPIADMHYAQMAAALRNIPLLQIDVALGSHEPSVVIDQRLGSYRITQHVIELGHTAIAEIRGPGNWHGAIARHNGFQQALQAHGLRAAASAAGNWTAESGYAAAQTLLNQAEFTAIVVANDQMALGAISCLRQHHLRVPEDVSVVGFDDIPEARFFSPPLTTVLQDFSALGRTGLEYLIALIDHPDVKPDQHVIEPTLVIRKSARSPR